MAFTGDYEPSGTQWVREQVEQIMGTGTTEGVTVRDLPIVLVTYRGVKSGKVRKTPLMRVEHDGRYVAVASQGGAPANPQWYTSLVANPVVEVQDGAATGEYRAREISGEEKAEWWRRAVDAYPPYADYQLKTDRQIPVFVLEPTA
jgi:deazaflavin-dependent oxidoreductase (nitroreductase family)